ncbi:hypothetical protein, partial [Methanosphaera stadtmanae]|uniref:hypothetical protein n=1 Tax=Methanosphaera stadtmanae TaxID=2317 RepID=UPI0026750520
NATPKDIKVVIIRKILKTLLVFKSNGINLSVILGNTIRNSIIKHMIIVIKYLLYHIVDKIKLFPLYILNHR